MCKLPICNVFTINVCLNPLCMHSNDPVTNSTHNKKNISHVYRIINNFLNDYSFKINYGIFVKKLKN